MNIYHFDGLVTINVFVLPTQLMLVDNLKLSPEKYSWFKFMKIKFI